MKTKSYSSVLNESEKVMAADWAEVSSHAIKAAIGVSESNLTDVKCSKVSIIRHLATLLLVEMRSKRTDALTLSPGLQTPRGLRGSFSSNFQELDEIMAPRSEAAAHRPSQARCSGFSA
jgi:hypothetical protein